MGLALSQLLTIIAFLIVLGALSAFLFTCSELIEMWPNLMTQVLEFSYLKSNTIHSNQAELCTSTLKHHAEPCVRGIVSYLRALFHV